MFIVLDKLDGGIYRCILLNRIVLGEYIAGGISYTVNDSPSGIGIDFNAYCTSIQHANGTCNTTNSKS